MERYSGDELLKFSIDRLISNFNSDQIEVLKCVKLTSALDTPLSSDLRVDENGKIHRLRRECPAETCGAGVFMAAHENRAYCGKCTLTFVDKE
ncbi:CLUMA_CG012060, isoform A [Clunio marinus]|uniref:CLUMA_CG012060, isoform A n=1 Tax=Clunio marinus TaxID=568069 RepID=A0A1J1IF37_9DIPT|nr:CLUMA_CG012060, isoform A [Clunio marinus]